MSIFKRPGALFSYFLIAVLSLSSCKDDAGKPDQSGSASEPAEAKTQERFSELSGQLKQIAETLAGEGRGAIVYLRLDDGQEWTESAGTRKEDGPGTTGDEHFEIGSITKLFTAVSVLQLSETEALDLNAPLGDFFDAELLSVLVGGEKGDVSLLEVRHLLNHSTGIGDYINIGSDEEALAMYGTKGDKEYTPMELLNLTKSYTLDPSLLPADHPPLPWKTLRGGEPGEDLENYDAMPGAFYSNTGYVMLGMIIEKASAMKYEDYVSQHILKPLGMKETGFRTREANSDFTGYATGIETGPVAMSPSFAWSAGAVVTTTSDLANFLDAALEGKLFKEDSTLEYWTKEGFLPLMGVDFLPKYGHGLMWKSIGDLDIFGHDGQTFGATALVARCDKLGATIVLSRNDSQHSDMWGRALAVLGALRESIKAEIAAETTE